MGAIINFFKKMLGIKNQNLLEEGIPQQVVNGKNDEQNKYEETLREFKEKKEKVDNLLEEVKAEKESVENGRDEELFSEKPEEEKDYKYITQCNVKIEELTNRVDKLANESYRLENIIFDMEINNNPEINRLLKDHEEQKKRDEEIFANLRKSADQINTTYDDIYNSKEVQDDIIRINQEYQKMKQEKEAESTSKQYRESMRHDGEIVIPKNDNIKKLKEEKNKEGKETEGL